MVKARYNMKKRLNLAELLSIMQHYANRKWVFQDVFDLMHRDYDMPKSPELKPILAREYDTLCVYSKEVKNRYGRIQ